MSSSQSTLYFHDYETWGTDPKNDPACQFAGLRTDLDLNIVGNPLVIFSQPFNDYLPHPEACLVTGITPQKAMRDGMGEIEFIRKIHKELSTPGTCTVGYNNIRFDDEVTRYTLYRNLMDPYAREWQHGNSRWDIIDMVRACYALRPDGINWVFNDDGNPVFKLEVLTQANDIEHGSAHDALSDVTATIALAKLIKTHQAKLYQFIFENRGKRQIQQLINYENHSPLVHVSSKLPSTQGCTTWIAPVCPHPVNKNAVIAINLQSDLNSLLDLTVEEIARRLYAKKDELEEGQQRPGLKLIHTNKCPVLAPAKTLLPENAERLGINRDACLSNWQTLKNHPELVDKIKQVYLSERQWPESDDPEHQLYSGPFFSDTDKRFMEKFHQQPIEHLLGFEPEFEDKRLKTLLFRIKARNFSNSLTYDEQQKWHRHRQKRLVEGDGQHLTIDDFTAKIGQLMTDYSDDAKKSQILKDLLLYSQSL